GCGVGSAGSEQPPFPIWTGRIEQVLEEMVDQTTEPLFRRVRRLSHRFTISCSKGARIHGNPGVEFRFIAKMIIHGGYIDSSALGDCANSGAFKTLFSEDLPGGA